MQRNTLQESFDERISKEKELFLSRQKIDKSRIAELLEENKKLLNEINELKSNAIFDDYKKPLSPYRENGKKEDTNVFSTEDFDELSYIIYKNLEANFIDAKIINKVY